MSVSPAPLMVEPSGRFDGNDGTWSSFTIRVGNPPTNVRVLVSTLVPETWVILPAGCTFNDPTDCKSTRGSTFDIAQSSTWIDKGTWSLGAEGALGINQQDGGDYGYDTLGVQLHGSTSGGVTLDHQVIAGIATKDFYLGNLGLAPRMPNFNDSTQPSFLQSLKTQNLIPSLSYGYTAGAFYRGDKTFASLTLGGYDASKLTPNDVLFSLASIATHDIVVGIQSISFSNSNTAGTPLMAYGEGKLAFIDSTLPNLWLPTSVCDAFAQAFGLQFQPLHLYYTINDTMHATNIKQKASVIFQLGNFVTGGKTVNITLPYESLALNSTALIQGNTTRYFPLRQANTADQYTLGRAFLQEAFLSVDYERGVFNVSQVDFSGNPSHIIAIQPLNTTGTGTGPGGATISGAPSPSTSAVLMSQSSGLGTSAIAGIAVGIVLLAIILASAVIFVACRKRKRRKQQPQGGAHELPAEDQRSPTGFVGYLKPFSKHHHDSKASATAHEYAVEHDGKEVNYPQTSHAAADPAPLPELHADVLRAELQTPEPGDTGAVSPQSEKPNMDLPIESTPHREPPSPNMSLTAFQSPTIGYTRYNDVTTPPPLSPNSEKDNFFQTRS